MTIEDAQREVRTVYLGGFTSLLVSGALWALSASFGTWLTPRPAILTLVLGGMLIHPLSQLGLRLMGRPSAGDQSHLPGQPDPGAGSRRPQFPQYLFGIDETAGLGVILSSDQGSMQGGLVSRVEPVTRIEGK